MNDISFPKPSMTAKDIFKDQIAATNEDAPTLFSLKAQMLDKGRTDTVLAATEDLSVRLKVYASGGENGLHAHVDVTAPWDEAKTHFDIEISRIHQLAHVPRWTYLIVVAQLLKVPGGVIGKPGEGQLALA